MFVVSLYGVLISLVVGFGIYGLIFLRFSFFCKIEIRWFVLFFRLLLDLRMDVDFSVWYVVDV